MLKTLLGGLLIVLLVLAASAYLLPARVHVSRTVSIDRPPAQVFPLVNSLRRFNDWSPWSALDPDLQVAFTGPDAGVGAAMAWRGNRSVGTGHQSIIASIPDRAVRTELMFGDQGAAHAAWLLSPTDTGTRVEWTLDVDLGVNPIGRYVGLFMDRMVGPDYERGLARLKSLAEQAPPAAQPVSSPTTSVNAPTS